MEKPCFEFCERRRGWTSACLRYCTKKWKSLNFKTFVRLHPLLPAKNHKKIFTSASWIKSDSISQKFIPAISLHLSISTWQLKPIKSLATLSASHSDSNCALKTCWLTILSCCTASRPFNFPTDFPRAKPIRSQRHPPVRCCNRLLALNADTAADTNSDSELVQSMAA